MKVAEKEKARLLRKQGKSINQIVEQTGFSKASVSSWVRDILLTNAQRKRISERGRSVEGIERRRLNRIANEENKRQIVIEKAKKDFSLISSNELKIIGIALYLGEGGKTKRLVRFSNSDPKIIGMMMRFFREICLVPEEKFRGHIHIFEHADIRKAENYWSKVTGIPKSQFYKTYAKSSNASLHKRNYLMFGTFDIYVCDTKLFLTIMGWIEKISELVLKQ